MINSSNNQTKYWQVFLQVFIISAINELSILSWLQMDTGTWFVLFGQYTWICLHGSK